jgi:transcriptional regulator GlxA family with amidase domain
VTDTALRWGFSHFGRFAESYRAQYGQTPNQTLRSAKSS